jgi:hypothetical protein
MTSTPTSTRRGTARFAGINLGDAEATLFLVKPINGSHEVVYEQMLRM